MSNLTILHNYRYRIKQIILLLTSLVSIILLNNNLKKNIDKFSTDEGYTVAMAFNSISGVDYESVRVGESTRLLAKFTYPFAIYYMNKYMGGEHYITTWYYPGGFYLKNNYKGVYHLMENQDPNIQDFWYAMRFFCGVLVVLSFLISSIFILKNETFIAALVYLLIALFSGSILETLKIFYTESSMLIAINLIIIYYYSIIKNPWRSAFIAAFLIVFCINIKLTGIILTIPIFFILINKRHHNNTEYFFEGFFIFTILIFILFMLNIPSVWQYIEEQLSNIYHYQTGHLTTQPSGLYQLKSILRELGPIIFVSPLVFIIYLINSKLREHHYLSYILLLISVIIIIQLVDSRFFVKRNLTTVFVLLLYPTSIFLGKLIENYNNKWVARFIFFFLFIFLGLQLKDNYTALSQKSFSENTKEITNYAIVDFSKEIFNKGSNINSMPEEYMLKKDLKKLENQFNGFSYVLVNRIKNNKQYTNFILPRKFNLITRDGPYFLFKRKAISHNR